MKYYNLKIPDTLIEYCQILIDNKNFGQRKKFNGNKEQQLTGLIGENAVRWIFGAELMQLEDGPDGGIDFEFLGKKIDVKTIGRNSMPKDSYINNFVAYQDQFNPDLYIFASYHKTDKMLSICGWLTKQEFVEKRTFYPTGSIAYRSDGTSFERLTDSFEIKNSQLRSFFELLSQKV